MKHRRSHPLRLCRVLHCMKARRRWHHFCGQHERLWRSGTYFFLKMAGKEEDSDFFYDPKARPLYAQT